jgi:tRNA threonylcarbamoyladenosine biosynthesis protein TsaB
LNGLLGDDVGYARHQSNSAIGQSGIAGNMLTLGIETSGRTASIALRSGGRTLVERTLGDTGRRHAQTLVAEIDAALKEQGRRAGDIGLVAVSIGPGSFTGLRIGVVCAKTLAYATGCRLAAVDTFACIAENSPSDVDDVCVIADAQRGELYVGRYRRIPSGEFEATQPIAIVPGEAWCSALMSQHVVSGPGVARFERELPPECRVLPADLREPSAGRVAELGQRRLERLGPDNFWTLEPFYLRKSSAEEKWATQNRGASERELL